MKGIYVISYWSKPIRCTITKGKILKLCLWAVNISLWVKQNAESADYNDSVKYYI